MKLLKVYKQKNDSLAKIISMPNIKYLALLKEFDELKVKSDSLVGIEKKEVLRLKKEVVVCQENRYIIENKLMNATKRKKLFIK